MISILSRSAYILLFPFIFFYSSGVAAGVIPSVIGGGHGFILSAFGVLLAPYALRLMRHLTGWGIGYALCFLAFILIACAQVFFSSGQYAGAAKAQWVSVIASLVLLLPVGAMFYRYGADSSKAIQVLLLAILATVVLNINVSSMMYAFGVNDSDSALSYQGLARSAAYTALAAIAFSFGQRKELAFFLMGAVSIFFIGARSELVAYMLLLPIICYLQYKNGGGRKILGVGVLVMGGIIFAGTAWIDQISTSRQFQLFDIGNSTSMQARNQLSESGWEGIAGSPFVGDFGGHVIYGSSGGYMHNAFSAWRQLGMIGFFLYLVLNLAPLAHLLSRLLKRPREVQGQIKYLLYLSVFNAALVAAVKPVFWVFPAFLWGAYLSFLIAEKTPSRSADTSVAGSTGGG